MATSKRTTASDPRAEFLAKWSLDENELNGTSANESAVSITRPHANSQKIDAWEPCIVEHTAGALPETLLTFSAQEFLDVFTMDLWNGLSGDEQEALRKFLPNHQSREVEVKTLHEIFDGKPLRFGRNPVLTLWEKLNAGYYHAEVVKLREYSDAIKSQKSRIDRTNYHDLLVHSIIDKKKHLGLPIDEDIAILHQIKTDQHGREDEKLTKNSTKKAKGRDSLLGDLVQGLTKERMNRARKLLPEAVRDVPEYVPVSDGSDTDSIDDGDLPGDIDAEEPGAEPPAPTVGGQPGVGSTQPTPIPAAGQSPAPKPKKKRKRGEQEPAEPGAAEAEGDETASASKSKKRKERPRSELKKMNIVLPIEVFSLFSLIKRTCGSSGTSAATIIEEVQKNPRVMATIPTNYSADRIVALAISFLENPQSADADQLTPLLDNNKGTLKWVGDLDDGKLEQLETLFWFAVSRNQLDSSGNAISLAFYQQHKGQATMQPSPLEVVLEYQRQEAARYTTPEKGYCYRLGSQRSIVAPCKATASKREHAMLRPDRPPCVSVLSLVRDAASKLPGGVGSRPDVTLLLRESQYVVETVEEAAFSSLVSGALDRLKSDLDPSVRYDGELKLWIYLHRQREMADYENYWTKLKDIEKATQAQHEAGEKKD